MTKKTLPKKLGIIAGAGVLPIRLIKACDELKIETFVVGFQEQTDPDCVEGRQHIWSHVGCAGQIIQTLHAHHVEDICMIGSVRRPSLSEMRPDLRTIKFFLKHALKFLGDDSLLKAVRAELEGEGFRIHGVQEFVQGLIVQEGILGKYKPQPKDSMTIKRGVEVARTLGELDVGQSCIVQQDLVLGVEGIEGTDNLIARCKSYKRKGRGGILVKMSKPNQDKDMDLPTIGPETVRHAIHGELCGIVVHAGNTLMVDAQLMTALADKYKIFIAAVDPDKS